MDCIGYFLSMAVHPLKAAVKSAHRLLQGSTTGTAGDDAASTATEATHSAGVGAAASSTRSAAASTATRADELPREL